MTNGMYILLFYLCMSLFITSFAISSAYISFGNTSPENYIEKIYWRLDWKKIYWLLIRLAPRNHPIHPSLTCYFNFALQIINSFKCRVWRAVPTIWKRFNTFRLAKFCSNHIILYFFPKMFFHQMCAKSGKGWVIGAAGGGNMKGVTSGVGRCIVRFANHLGNLTSRCSVRSLVVLWRWKMACVPFWFLIQSASIHKMTLEQWEGFVNGWKKTFMYRCIDVLLSAARL